MRCRLLLACLVAGCAQPTLGPGTPDLEDPCEPPPIESVDPGASVEALSSISCGSRVDTGYRSGSAFAIEVVTVDGRPVERETANAYYVMAEAAAAGGVQLRIVSGFRTMAEQEHLYYCYTSCSCNGCNLAARPGYSNHQSGHALDLNTSASGVYRWLSAHGADYGFRRTVPSEDWHWEWWGGGPGGGPCGGVPPPRDDDGDGSPSTEDCDDHDARRTPGRADGCDGVDNDCDRSVDEHLSRTCGSDVGECVAGSETCHAGTWGSCAGEVRPSPEACDRLDNDCDGTSDDEQVCEREEALLGPGLYGPTLDTDVDGDGLPDACALLGETFSCLAGNGHGFERRIDLALGALPAERSAIERAAGIRMADVDGDGRSDVCSLDGDRLRCWRSSGESFEDSVATPALGAGVTSVELADVDGDGRVDACARTGRGLTCWLATDHGFEGRVSLAALSDAGGFRDVVHHGTLRFGDVNGDRRTDVCARDAAGVDCWLATSEGFGERVRGPRWSDAAGFDALSYWSTLRLIDVDGDGSSDLCARTPSGFRCALWTGTGFGAELRGPPMSAAEGWSEPTVYTTLRMADVDGDGTSDVCAREADRVRCWLFGGHAFDRVALGPTLDEGWQRPARYRSFRLVDVDGDRRADVCARSVDALRCYASTGGGFDRVWVTPAWGEASGLDDADRAASIRLASAEAIPGAREAALRATMGCSISRGPGRSHAPSGLALVGVAVALAVLTRKRRPARHAPGAGRSQRIGDSSTKASM